LSRGLRLEVGAFLVVWFLLLLHLGGQAYASIAWDNVFLHCLFTVVLTAVVSALLTGLSVGFYWILRGLGGGWGRLLVVPWICLGAWRYPYILAKGFPDTNPDPQGTAIFFAALEGAGILLLGLAAFSLFFW
jgi:hypothetical protein